MGYTRRTHIVRVPEDPDNPDTSKFIDVEVLDAIAFKTTQGHDVILSMKAAAADPYIVDDTGGGHERKPSQGTSRSHMKRITSTVDPTLQLDVEVADIMAFNDTNGGVWILDMKSTTGDGPSVFDSVDGGGDATASRRVHSEKITVPFGVSHPTDKKSYLTMQRCDTVAFRTINGHVAVFSSPSFDDGSGDRAQTFTTPDGYDPNDDSKNAVKPPYLKDSGDKHNYVNFVKDATGVLTGDEKIQMGPFWWIRKVSGGKAYLFITVTASAKQDDSAPEPPTASASGDFFIDSTVPETTQTLSPPVTTTNDYYFMWAAGPPFPTAETIGTITPFASYGGQWAIARKAGNGGWLAPLVDQQTGYFASLEAAQAAVVYVNGQIFAGPSPYLCSYWPPFPASFVENAGFEGFYAGHLAVDSTGRASGSSKMTQSFLFGPLPQGASAFAVNFGGADVAGVDAKLINGVTGTVTSIDTFNGGVTLAEGNGGGRAIGFGIDVFLGTQADGSDSSVIVNFVSSGGGAV